MNLEENIVLENDIGYVYHSRKGYEARLICGCYSALEVIFQDDEDGKTLAVARLQYLGRFRSQLLPAERNYLACRSCGIIPTPSTKSI